MNKFSRGGSYGWFAGRVRRVAQIFNLLYRRVALGRTVDNSKSHRISAPAQNAILRYSRVQLCATSLAARIAIPGIAIVALASCTMMPKYERPASPVAGQWPNGPEYQWPSTNAPQFPLSTNAAEIGWREFFGDPRLKRLVSLALENNRDLRVAILNVESVQAQYQVAQLALIPTLNATGTFDRQRVPIGFADNGQALTFSQYSVSVGTVNYEVDLWGRVRSIRKEALETLLASGDDRITAQISLVAQVAVQYLTERELDEEIGVAVETRDATSAYRDLIQKIYDLGNASELDLRSAEAQAEAARAAIASLTRQRAQAENALAVLIGCAMPADLPAPLALDSQALLEDLPAGLPSDLLQRRPDIRSAEQTLKAANANIGAARAAFFPKVTLTANGGSTSLEMSGLFGQNSLAWQFMPQITLPIFDAGVNKANLEVANITKRIEIAQYEKVIQTAFREVADGLTARTTFDEQIDAQRLQVSAEQRRYDLADARYRNGVDTFLTVLTAQQDLYASQQLLIQARFSRLANLVTLYKALGGGWKDYIPSGTASVETETRR